MNNILTSSPVGLLAQLVDWLHRYRRGQGFESRTGLNFFVRPYFHFCLSCVHYCEVRFHVHFVFDYRLFLIGYEKIPLESLSSDWPQQHFTFAVRKGSRGVTTKNHFHSINYCNDVLIVSSKTANVIIIANPSKSPRFCRNITRRFLSDLDVMLANISGTWDGNNEALFVMVTVALKHKRMEC